MEIVSHAVLSAECFVTPLIHAAFERDIPSIASCYRQVFGTDRAWNEGKICRSCSRPGMPRKWNLQEVPDTCTDCQGALEEMWPAARVIAKIRSELAWPDAVCAVLRKGDEVIGAGWGFSATAEALEAQLNRGLHEEMRATGMANRLHHLYPGVARFAYQNEIFVLPQFQRMGLGKRLFALRHQGFVERGLGVYVIRTKRNPPATSYTWFFDRWGYVPIANHPDADERVILAHSFDEVSRYL